MDWWQGILIVLAFIVVGLLVGYLLSYLIITRILKEPFSKKRKITRQQFEEQLTREAEEGERKEVVVVEGPLESVAPDLVAEAENNRRIATEPWSGKLPPLRIITRILKEPFSKKRKITRQQFEEQLTREAEERERKGAEREAKERTKREAKEAKERAKREAKEAKERTKREAEEAKRAKEAAVVEGLLESIAPDLVEEAGKVREAEEEERKEAAVVERLLESIAPDLVAEAENNHRIATEPWSDKLLPFQTRVWDARQDEVYKLPGNLREDLTQAYVDMRLANSIVWLSTELGRRSHNLDENYMKLCATIAVRLDRVKPLLKWSSG